MHNKFFNIFITLILLLGLASCNGGGAGGGPGEVGEPTGDVVPDTTGGSSSGGGDTTGGVDAGAGEGTTSGGASTGVTSSGSDSGGTSGGTTSSGSDSGGTGGAVVQNTPPTISVITTKTINEDSSLDNVAFTITDAEQALSCQSSVSIELSSVGVSNYNANAILLEKIKISGTAPNCLLSLVPEADQSGTIKIILKVIDGEYGATSIFDVSVVAVDDLVSIPQVTNQLTQKNVPTNLIPISFSDIDGSGIKCESPNLVAGSSNQAVVQNNSPLVKNMEITGTVPNCYLKITPVQNASGKTTITITGTDNPYTTLRNVKMSFELSVFGDAPQISSISNLSYMEDASSTNIPFTISDSDTSLSCLNSVAKSSSNLDLIAQNGITISGTAPNCILNFILKPNASGSTTISLTVSDGLSTSQTTFVVNVSPVNDAPTISGLVNKVINEDVPVAAFNFSINDIDSNVDCSSITKSVTSTPGYPSVTPGWVLPTAGIVIGGTAPNCTIALSPGANANGMVTITLTVSDGALTGTGSFTLNVVAVNDAPVVSGLVDQNTNEDTISAYQKIIMSDIESVLTCPTAVSATSSNQAIILNSSIEISKIGSDCYIRATPVANANGVVNINLSVTDGKLSTASTFSLNVVPVNDPPTISSVANQSINKNGNITNLAFTINDIDTTLSCDSSVTKTSSNEKVVPITGITISGTAPNCIVNATPSLDARGGATISLKLNDGATTVTSKFNVSIDFANFTKLTGASMAYVGATSMATDTLGNTYYAGMTDRSLDGVSLTGGATSNGLVVKYDKSGTKLWTKLFAVNSVYTNAQRIFLDSSDNLFVSGTTKGSTSLIQGFVIKITSGGSTSWTKTFSSSGVASVTDVISTGQYTYATGIDGTSLFLVKITDTGYAGAGTVQWLKSYNIGSLSYSDRIRMIFDGSNFYFSGTTTTTLNGVAKTGTSDIFLMKCDSNGNAIWTKLIGVTSSITRSLEIFKWNNLIYLFGHSNGAIDGLTGDLFFVKFDTNGARTLSTILDLPLATTVSSWNPIKLDISGNIYAASGNNISKFLNTGELIFNRTNSGFTEPLAIHIDSFENIFSLGQANSVLEGQTPAGVFDAYLSTKYSFD